MGNIPPQGKRKFGVRCGSGKVKLFTEAQHEVKRLKCDHNFEKDQSHYVRSGGGVAISGCLMRDGTKQSEDLHSGWGGANREKQESNGKILQTQ